LLSFIAFVQQGTVKSVNGDVVTVTLGDRDVPVQRSNKTRNFNSLTILPPL